MNKKIIIIGAGIAGLSAACYGQMNGFDTEIYEMHKKPGGLCTAWKREGYTLDGCIHWLVGSNPGTHLYKLWEAVGAWDGSQIIQHDYYLQIEGDAGQKLILYSDMEQLENHLLEISAADAPLIKELTQTIGEMAKNMNRPEKGTNRLHQMSMQAFAAEFKNPFLREAFSSLNDLRFFLSTMAAYCRRDAGWPVGGSLNFARRIEKRVLDLGGQINYKARVQEIIVQNDLAVGVRLVDGSEHFGDYVVSAADGYETLFHILKGRYINEEIKSLYSISNTIPTTLQVSLGIDYDLADEPHTLLFKLKQPIRVGNEEKYGLYINHYGYDKTICPAGKSVITCFINTDFGYWNRLHQDGQAYQAEKEAVGSAVARAVTERFPMIAGKIEVIDVATPVTYNRYTNAWNGAYMGWKSNLQNPIQNFPTTLPGLKNFFLTGQWTYPGGGLPVALITGRMCMMTICKREGKNFIERVDLPAALKH